MQGPMTETTFCILSQTGECLLNMKSMSRICHGFPLEVPRCFIFSFIQMS
jgi:hypothetical protein